MVSSDLSFIVIHKFKVQVYSEVINIVSFGPLQYLTIPLQNLTYYISGRYSGIF